MKILETIVGWFLVIAAVAWFPAGITLTFLGIWHDWRWIPTGLIMIVFGIAVLAGVFIYKTARKIEKVADTDLNDPFDAPFFKGNGGRR